MTTEVTSLPAPWPLSDIQPSLHVFRRGQTPLTLPYPTQLGDAAGTLLMGGLLPTPRLIFIVHGYENNARTPWLEQAKDEIVALGDETVAVVGWGAGADTIDYPAAAANTQVLGEWVGECAQELGAHANSVWGVGHSLGAHALGKAGRTSGAFCRITGLDPAGPEFERAHHNLCLRKTDAPLVDVIHTDGYCAYPCPINHFGTLLPLGHVDFYPNFGYSQPGVGLHVAGSHARAHTYFISSINRQGKFGSTSVLDETPGFERPVTRFHSVAERAEMGYHADQGHTSGNFYLKTNSAAPWVDCADDWLCCIS